MVRNKVIRHWLEVTMYAGEKYLLSCRISANCSSETEYIQSDVNSIECKMYIEISEYIFN